MQAPTAVPRAPPGPYRPSGQTIPPRRKRNWGLWGRRGAVGFLAIAAVKTVSTLFSNPYEEEVAFMDDNGHIILVSENGDAVDLGPDPTGRKWMELGLNDR